MIRTVNGKSVNIPDKEIESYMRSLDLTKEQAIEMWLDDEGYTDNEEQLELEKKAKENGIMRDIHGASATDKAKKTTPKTVKASEEKQQLFKDICRRLDDLVDDLTVLKENKLIQVEINGKIFKIDVIEQRPKKK